MLKEGLDTGVIYAITSKTSGKSYIGQAKDYKYKDDIPYRYGLIGRWNDHVASSNDTCITEAIRQYGPEDFTINTLLRCQIEELDAWEAATIKHNNTLYPNGYNVMRHSRVKNREESNIHEFFIKRTVQVEVKPIKKDGENKIVYVYLKLIDEPEPTRLTFGQGKNTTFDTAVKEALDFTNFFERNNIPIIINPGIYGDDPLSKYHKKIEELTTKPIEKIRITTMGSLIAVYVSHEGIKSYKDQIRVTFGGKNISNHEALKLAKLFTNKIKGSTTIVVEAPKLHS